MHLDSNCQFLRINPHRIASGFKLSLKQPPPRPRLTAIPLPPVFPKTMFSVPACVSRATSLFLALTASLSAQLAFEWSEVPGSRLTTDINQIQTNGVSYRISKYETTMAQWGEFLNAKANISDPHGLFRDWSSSPTMQYDSAITRSGSAGSYVYTVNASRAALPVFGTRRHDVMRYINWLHNGKGNGDTENGAYDMSQPVPSRTAAARYFIPSHMEWLTAVYGSSGHFNGGQYRTFWEYPHGSDTPPPVYPDINYSRNRQPWEQWFQVYNHNLNFPSPHGLIHAGGNVSEWIETPPNTNGQVEGIVLGGSADSGAATLSFTNAANALNDPQHLYRKTLAGHPEMSGFRVAGVIAPSFTNAVERSFTVFPGETTALTFGGTLKGSAPAFQWYLGEPGNTSQPVAGATTATYTPPAATVSQSYWVRATNPLGSADSLAIHLKVIVPYTHQGDDNLLTNLTSDLPYSTINEVREVVASGQTHVLFVHSGRLYSVPFNGGPRVDLTTGLASPSIQTSTTSQFSTSIPDSRNTRLWTAHGTNAYYFSSGSIYKVPVAGGTPVALVTGLSGTNYFRISPDGSHVYFISNQSLQRVPTAGGAATILVNATSLRCYSFILSGDATRILFSGAAPTTTYNMGLYSMPVAGGTQTRLNNPNALPNNDARAIGLILASPNSTRVVYDADDDTNNVFGIYSVPVAGGTRTILESRSSTGSGAIISPDGTRLAYTSSIPVAQGGTGTSALYSIPIAGGTRVQHNQTPQISYAGYNNPIRFSPDSQRLVAGGLYNGTHSQTLFGFIYNNYMPFSWTATGTVPSQLADSPIFDYSAIYHWDVLPDNTGIAYAASYTSGANDLKKASLTGTNQTKLDGTYLNSGILTSQASGRRFETSGDGSRIVFVKRGDRAQQNDFYSVKVSDTSIRRLNPHCLTHNLVIGQFGPIGDGDSGWFVGNLDDSARHDLYLTRRPAPTPAVFLTHPASATINQNESVTLSATAEGTGPISFQWYLGNSGDISNPISGATSPTYTTPPLTGVSHRFWVRATNPVGNTDSPTATITLTQPPTIATQPAGATVLEGNTANLSVTATGSGTLSYQWYQGPTGNTSTPIGTNAPALQTPPLTANTNFWVRVTNIYGSTDSQAATITIIPRIPAFTSPTTTNGTAGVAFAFQVTTTNGPNVITGTDLPAWLSIDPETGWLTGTPTASGNVTIQLVAENTYRSASSQLAISILPPKPVITSPPVFSGRQNDPLSYTITATQAPTSYSASGLPSGLSYSSGTGVITGTPTQNGTFAVTIAATNGGGTASATLTLTIAPPIPPPAIIQPAFASGYVNAPVNIQAIASNTPTSFQLQNAPAWLSVNASGILSGTPAIAGIFDFKLRASNQSGPGAYKDIRLTIEPNPNAPQITSPTTATGRVGESFTLQLTANPAATSFSSSSAIPGITFNTTSGSFGGTPTTAGTYTVNITGTNAFGPGKPGLLRITILPPLQVPVITSNTSIQASVGAPFTTTIAANHSPTGFTFTGLPAWLSQAGTTGQISGTPPTPGIHTFTVFATNGDGQGQPQEISLNVAHHPNAPRFSFTGPIRAYQGLPFSHKLPIHPAATSITASALPPGITLSPPSGTLGGTPTAAGEYTITFQASNANGSGPATEATLIVQPPPDTPSITSTLDDIARALTPYTLQLQAFSEIPVLSWSVTGLPNGLQFNPSTGIISGSPTELGQFQVTLSASNAMGSGRTSILSLRVLPGSNVPKITSSASANIAFGTPFTYQIIATNGPNLTYSAVNIPEGINFDAATGVISGSPLTPGTFDIKLTAANINGPGPEQTLKLYVIPLAGAPIILAPSSLFFSISQPLSYEIPISGMPPKPWPAGTGVFASNLPAGMSLNSSTGILSGYPTATTSGSFTLQASNAGVYSIGKLLHFSFFIGYRDSPQISGPSHLSTSADRSLSFVINSDKPCSTWVFDLFPSREMGFWTTLYSPDETTVSPTFIIEPSRFPRPGVHTYLVGGEASAYHAFGSRLVLGITGGLPLRIDPAPGAPRITSPAFLVATAGTQLNVSLSASGSPIAFDADFDGNLPKGVIFSPATGNLSGVPSAPGRYSFLARAKNTSGWSLPQHTSLIVLPAAAAPQAIASTSVNKDGSPPVYQVGQPFSFTQAFDGAPDFFLATDLPPGLVLNESTGEISGLPETPGIFTVKMRPISGTTLGAEVEVPLTILPADGSPEMAVDIAITGTSGTALDHTLTATPSAAGFNFSDLPDFLEVDTTTGHVGGTPFAPGTFRFIASAFNEAGQGFPVTVTINVAAAPGTPVITPMTAPAARVGEPFSLQLSANQNPDFFDADSLPYGLNLDPETGLITGTPLVPGVTEISVWAVNSTGIGGARIITLDIRGVAGTPEITNPASVRAAPGAPFTLQFTASPTATTFSLAPLPAGFIFDAMTGVLTGTPGEGTWTFTVHGSNNLGQGTPKTITLTTRGSPAEDWLTEAFGPDAGNPDIAGWNAIPYGDGIPNLVKYALDLHPLTPDRSRLPAASTEIHGGQRHLVFTILKNPDATDVTYTPEISSTLATGGWGSGPEHIVILEETPEMLKVRDALPQSSGNKRFIRLKVTIGD